jgi:hypothetical protein
VKTGELIAMRTATIANRVRSGSVRGERVARSIEAMTTSFYRGLLERGRLPFAQGSIGFGFTC